MSTRVSRGGADATSHLQDRYLPGVDGLRAVAVLSVILFHLDEHLLPGGFTGVDVFFVISGYVISRSLASSDARSLGAFLLDFYKRRVLRIFPALLVCLLVTGLFTILFIPRGFWLSDHNAWTGVLAFVGLSNLYLVGSLDGYFSARTPFNPFVHTWSLAVEEQFYVVLPLVFYLWLRERRDPGTSRRWVNGVLPAVAVLSFAWAVFESRAAPERAFYLLPSRFWELAAGVILFQVQSARPRAFDGIARGTVPLGVALLAVGFVWADKGHFPFPWAVVPVVGTVLLIIGATTPAASRSPVLRLLAAPATTWVGRLSYSLYLWHWPVFVLFRWTVGLETPGPAAAALALTAALAWLSYRYVETEVRSSRRLASLPSWKLVSAGAVSAGMALVLMAGAFTLARPLGLSLSVTRDRCVWLPYDEQCAGQPAQTLLPAERNLFVIGDSHAGAYALMTHLAAGRVGARVHIRSVSGCSIVRLIEVEGDAALCREREREMLDWVTGQARPGDVVFLASLRVDRLGDQSGPIERDASRAADDAATQGKIRDVAMAEAVRVVTALQAKGLVVLMDAPKPVFPAPPFRCADWFNRTHPVCAAGFTVDRDRLLKHREPTMASLRSLEERLGVQVWDPFPVLCGGPVCSAFDGDKPLFFDGDHMSGYGNLKLVDAFSDQLRTIWRIGRQDSR